MNYFFAVIALSMVVGLCPASGRVQAVPASPDGKVDPGEPLNLTEYIVEGKLDEGRRAARVRLPAGTDVNVTSYSGYFTVNASSGGEMFAWFFPAKNSPETAPVLLWLQGGPGGPSMYGLFEENGPIYVDDKLRLRERDITWQTDYSMLYIDNPVGTGFSFVAKDEGYSTNEDQVAQNLYNALYQFFLIFYDLIGNDFYITGESYAGKYVPALAAFIDKENKGPPLLKINLKGVAIGDGLCDPINMMGYSDLLYNIGMIGSKQRVEFLKQEAFVRLLINNQKYIEAFKAFDMLLNGDLFKYGSLFYNMTGSKNYFNYLKTADAGLYLGFVQYLEQPEVRAAIHVGSRPFHQDNTVEEHLVGDMMRSVADKVKILLEGNYKVMFYNGQLDIIVADTLTDNFLNQLQWSGRAGLYNATRKHYKVQKSDTEIAGYFKNFKNVYQVVIRGAGHMVPTDQPERAYDLIQRFINGAWPLNL